MSLRRSGVFRVPPLRRTSDDVIDVDVISTPDSRLLYLSIMRFGAAKDTEITGIEPCWLVNWRHQTPTPTRFAEIVSDYFPILHPAPGNRTHDYVGRFGLRIRVREGRQLLVCGGSGARRAGRACRWLASEVTVALPLRDCSQ
jgi:hypothetical protein